MFRRKFISLLWKDFVKLVTYIAVRLHMSKITAKEKTKVIKI